MGKIFYILGKSASGKDTVFKRLLEHHTANLRVIVPYTTRPIRDGETEGVEYHFVTEADLRRLEAQGRVIELRAYHTVHGIWNYFTVDDGQIALEDNSYLMIGVLESFLSVRRFFGEDKLTPLFIDLEDGVRLQRALDRERAQDTPKYEELCRRFLADSVDFAEDKITAAGIQRRFFNNDLEECLEQVEQYILDSLQEQG